MRDDILQQVQQTELEIATEVFRVCKAHNIRCSLVGGTAIGAIRHKGFIPWDDDIDIAMPRADFERFIEVCKTDLDPRYFLQCFDTERNCAFIFGKVRKNDTYMPEEYSRHIDMHQGVWVDIFIYDNVSDYPQVRANDLRQLLLYKNLLIIKTGYKLPRNKTSIKDRIAFAAAKCITFFMSAGKLKQKCAEIMKRHSDENTQYIFPYGGAYSSDKELMPCNLFDDLIEVDFEDQQFPIFSNYDHYLTSLFGDYMTPPPPDKRGANHFLDESEIRL